MSVQGSSDQRRSEQSRAAQTGAEQTSSDRNRAGQGSSAQGSSSQSRPEQTRAPQFSSSQNRPAQPITRHTRPGQDFQIIAVHARASRSSQTGTEQFSANRSSPMQTGPVRAGQPRTVQVQDTEGISAKNASTRSTRRPASSQSNTSFDSGRDSTRVALAIAAGSQTF